MSPNKKLKMITRDTQTGLKKRPVETTNPRAEVAEAACSDFFAEQATTMNRESSFESTGTEVVGGAVAAAEIDEYLSRFSDLINHYVIKGDKIHEFNYPIDVLNIDIIQKILEDVFTQLPKRKMVVIALEVGYVLRHSVTEELRYFFGAWNTALGGYRVTLNSSNPGTLKKAVEYYGSLDLNSYLNNNRVSSPWQLERVVNIRCIVQFFQAGSEHETN